MNPILKCDIYFSCSDNQVCWHGRCVSDVDQFDAYLRGPVHQRLFDVEHAAEFEADMRAVATTGMAQDTIEQLLATYSNKEPWEVGEALAECLLLDQHGMILPWNTERDKRTPKASLPGADLVGFIIDGQGARLAFGEVKTSNDAATPPNVLYGKGGMINQLDRLVENMEIHHCLLRWLHPRCKSTDVWSIYKQAAARYLESGGRDIALFGLLMRDTEPYELDVRNRALDLSAHVSTPTNVELMAWYFPCPIVEWPSRTTGGSQ